MEGSLTVQEDSLRCDPTTYVRGWFLVQLQEGFSIHNGDILSRQTASPQQSLLNEMKNPNEVNSKYHMYDMQPLNYSVSIPKNSS